MKRELVKLAYMYGDANMKKQRKKRRNIIVTDLCVDYAENSTLHGLRYMTASGLTLLEKLFWLATFLVSVGLCGYFIENVYHKWRNNPVIVTVNEKLVSVDTVPFPSVTICPQQKLGWYNYTEELEKYRKNPDYKYADTVKDISLLCNHALHKSNRNFTNASTIETFQWYAETNIFESCYWQNSQQKCKEMFQEVYTAAGLCYNMNGIAASEMFRNTVQSEYNYSSRTLRSRQWSLEHGYTTSDNTPYPKRGNKNHASPDLEVFLSSREKEDPQCNGLRSGYEIYLHHPADIPQTSLYYYSAENNQVTTLAVSVQLEGTSDRLVNYSPKVRQCYFISDRYLRYFQNYTTKNCEAECVSNYTYKHCGCVGFYMPHNNSNEICAENKQKCMREAYDMMARKELNLENESDGCSCLPACNSVEYDAEVLKTIFIAGNYAGSKLRTRSIFGIMVTYKFNISKVEIYFKKPHYMSMRRSELFGTTDFLANIGGLLGLFLGFSFLSLVEICYFLTIKLGLALRRDIKKEKETLSQRHINNAIGMASGTQS